MDSKKIGDLYSGPNFDICCKILQLHPISTQNYHKLCKICVKYNSVQKLLHHFKNWWYQKHPIRFAEKVFPKSLSILLRFIKGKSPRGACAGCCCSWGGGEGQGDWRWWPGSRCCWGAVGAVGGTAEEVCAFFEIPKSSLVNRSNAQDAAALEEKVKETGGGGQAPVAVHEGQVGSSTIAECTHQLHVILQLYRASGQNYGSVMLVLAFVNIAFI